MAVWGYRLKDGEVEAQVFEEDLPKGWQDSPVKCVAKKTGAKKDDGK